MTIKARPLTGSILSMISICIISSIHFLSCNIQWDLKSLLIYIPTLFIFSMSILFIMYELSTSYPLSGGLFVWIEQAFGLPLAFFISSIQWMSKLLLLPAMFFLLSNTLAEFFFPSLLNSSHFIFLFSLTIFWLTSFLNTKGVIIYKWIAPLGALLGFIIPFLGLSLLNTKVIHYESILSTSSSSFNPSLFPLLSHSITSLLAIENGLGHIGELKKPRSSLSNIFFWISLGVFCLCFAMPILIGCIPFDKKQTILSSLMNLTIDFVQAQGLSFFTAKCFCLMVFIGYVCSLFTWILTITKQMHIASQSAHMPYLFVLTNLRKAPLALFILEGTLFTLIQSFLFYFDFSFPFYKFFLLIGIQGYLLSYIAIFPAITQIRKKHLSAKGIYHLSQKKLASLFNIGGLAIILFVFSGNIYYLYREIDDETFSTYVIIFLTALLLFFSIPLIIWSLRKKAAPQKEFHT
ncbi:MAG: amino acid permease [Rhabdochlamydiaceae bacterium]